MNQTKMRFMIAGLGLLFAASAGLTSFSAGVKDLPVRAEMPNPLVTEDGKPVSTPEQWKLRREEMKSGSWKNTSMVTCHRRPAMWSATRFGQSC